MPFVPKGYLSSQHDGFRVWYEQNEAGSNIELIIDAASYALDELGSRLKFKNSRKIEICIYHSNEQAVASLARNIPGNFAMAPYSNDKDGLVIVQNVAADSMNGDLQRMRRILAHEICHLFVREKSGSTQCLGDGLKDLNVRPWLDEGLAEYLSWRAIGEMNPVLNEDFEFIDNLEEVDSLLNDFNSDRRKQAFYTSFFLTEFYIGELGLPVFFESMVKLSETIEPLKNYMGK